MDKILEMTPEGKAELKKVFNTMDGMERHQYLKQLNAGKKD